MNNSRNYRRKLCIQLCYVNYAVTLIMCITDKDFKPLSLAVCLGVQQRAWDIICWWWPYVPPPKQVVTCGPEHLRMLVSGNRSQNLFLDRILGLELISSHRITLNTSCLDKINTAPISLWNYGFILCNSEIF